MPQIYSLLKKNRHKEDKTLRLISTGRTNIVMNIIVVIVVIIIITEYNFKQRTAGQSVLDEPTIFYWQLESAERRARVSSHTKPSRAAYSMTCGYGKRKTEKQE